VDGRGDDEQFRAYFEAAPVGIAIGTPAGRCVEVNAELCRILGYARDDLLTRSCAELVHPDDLAAATARLAGAAAGDADAGSTDVRLLRKDGGVVHALLSARPARGADGSIDRVVATVIDITERKREQDAILAAKARLDLATRGSGIGIWDAELTDGSFDHGVATRLDALEQLGHALPRPAIALAEVLELIHPDDREVVVNRMCAYLAGAAQGYEVEHRMVHRDGSYRWLLVRGVGARDGARIRMTGTSLDITDRKGAEQRLHASERSLATELAAMARLQEVGTQLVQAGDATSLLEEIVDAAIAITGADMGTMQVLDPESGLLRLVASRGFDRTFVEFFALVRPGQGATGTALRQGARVVVGDVEASYVFSGHEPSRATARAAGVRAVQATPLVSRDGRIVGMLATHYRTRRRPGERDLHVLDLLARQAADWVERTHAEDALRASEQRFRRTFECNMVPMGVWTRDGVIAGANDALLDLLGYTRADLDAGQLHWAALTPPEHRHRDAVALAEIKARGVSTPFEKEYLHKDGHRVPVLIGGAAFTGTASSGVFFAIDLSERKRVHEELEALLERERRARADAERAGRLKDDFLAVLSHELRTPLNAIVGWVEVIARGAENPDRVRRGIEVIARNARAQSQLIADLLDLSRISTGKLRLDVTRVALPAVVEAAVEAIRPAAATRDIHVHTTIEPVDHGVHGDAARLQQVLWNLLSNAVKFTPEGGRVEVVLARVDSHAEVVVCDTGRGIPPEFVPHVFERFRQADASAAREHGGLGIGLALVRELTELHGGTVRAASGGEGKGATFTIRLPLAILHGDAGDVREHARGAARIALASAEPLRLDGVRVLLVDDEPDGLEVIRCILEDRHADVTIAGSVDDALGLIDTQEFDVLLSDIGMPRRDGYDLIAEVRRRGHQTPAAAVTAFARSEDRTRTLLAGFQAHLTKPIEPTELLATVASLSGRIPL
jgi:PAS domain S-box-containing protein